MNLYNNNEISERESQKTIPLKVTLKNKIIKNKPDQDGERLICRKLLLKH